MAGLKRKPDRFPTISNHQFSGVNSLLVSGRVVFWLHIRSTPHPVTVTKMVATQIVFGIFSVLPEEDEPILTFAYFSDGLVQPPTR